MRPTIDASPILRRALDENYRKLSLVTAMLPLTALVSAAAFHGTHPVATLLAWCASVGALSALSWAATRRYFTRQATLSLTGWARLRTVSAGLNGLSVGAVLATVLYVPDNPLLESFMTTVVVGTTAAALLSSSTYFPALRTFQVVNTAPLILRFAMEGGSTRWALATLLAMFLAASLALGHRLNATFRQSLTLALENEALLNELGQARDFLAEANANLSQKVAERTHELQQALESKAESDARLLQAQRMEAVGLLAGTVAHDFNNLLTGIMGFASLAVVRTPKDHPSQDALSEVVAGCERAASLTQQLLTFSRGSVAETASVDLCRVIENLTPMLESLIGADGQLVTTLPHQALHVQSSASGIDQLLMNLVINARDATKQDARVEIVVDAVDTPSPAMKGRYARLRVSDNGSGIADSIRQRLFEPFFSTKGEAGHGLGLTTCFGVVQRAGGTIEVESTGPSGTTFLIYLPEVSQARNLMAATPQ